MLENIKEECELFLQLPKVWWVKDIFVNFLKVEIFQIPACHMRNFLQH